MTHITEERLEEFKTIYKNEYWSDITDDEALELWDKFIYLLDILFNNIDIDDWF